MKRILSVFLVPMVILIFCGTALAKDSGAGKQIVAPSKKKIEAPRFDLASLTNRDRHDSSPQAKGPDKEIDKDKYVQCIPQHRPPIYCTPILSHFCQELCGDVSPSRCGGSHKWGKKCGPITMKKCQKCGFLE